MKLILDTNALVNLMIPMIVESHEAMRELVPLAHAKRVSVMTSASSVLDASWILENGRAPKVLIPDKTKRRQLAWMLRMSIFTSMEIEAVDDAVLRKAHKDVDEEDLEDAVVATVGAFNDANYLVTDDRRAFLQSGMIKLTPAEALRYLKSTGPKHD